MPGLDDLRHLAGPEAARRGVQLAWENLVEEARVGDATAVRQVVLNLLLNAVAASPPRSTVSLSARQVEGRLTIAVADQGEGLPATVASMLAEIDPAAPTGGKGLGLLDGDSGRTTSARNHSARGGGDRHGACT